MPVSEPQVERREQLLQVAERLFAQKGYQATSIRDIADELNIRGGSLYAHIEGKDDLLWEIVNGAAQRFFAAIDPIIRSDLVPVEKLRRLILAHVQVITQNLDAAAVFSNEWRNLTPARRDEFRAKRDAYEHIVRDLVSKCIEEGTFASVDEKFATLLILSTMNWIYQWYSPRGPMDPEEIARKLTNMLFNGLRRASA